jgi:starch synthase
MKKTKILFIAQEIAPYLPENKISSTGRFLPQKIQEAGNEIRTFMPKYGSIKERRNQLHEVIRLSGMNLIINNNDHPLTIKVASIQTVRMQVYFIDNEDYFGRKHPLQDENGDFYTDNDERSIFFARGVIETIKKLNWSPDLVHCIGWFTGLVPLYIKTAYNDEPLFNNTKIVYSAYNEDFNKPFQEQFHKKVLMEGVDKKDVEVLKESNLLSLNKLAINMSDGVIFGDDEVNKSLEAHIKSTETPLLPFTDNEEFAQDYHKFYNEILGKAQ